MELHDAILDEAEEIARLNILPPHASVEEIVKEISMRLNVQISPNSTFGRLAEAAYNRISQPQLVS